MVEVLAGQLDVNRRGRTQRTSAQKLNAMMQQKLINLINDGGVPHVIVSSIDPWLFVRGEAEPAITAVVNDFSQFFQEH
ncbi:MAG: hypothetical protein NT053_06440 [Cyanobacteria bacterium]|nr:hypothetical protein [Cyanobacteriota bacterium]